MKSSIKTITLVIGTALGALLGFEAARTLIKQSEAAGKSTPVTASQALQVGLGALGLLRQVSGGRK
ncbi:MAG TPA: hypothetical protein PLO92_07250 [Anaerolineaceae bacterium]|jgi:hypothetical protein|nr:hypothetical protein [Anaerolineaceae bacterium]HOR84683.1 hypothetical protein [Anaerolineaceae bacterium]HOT52467.1 hypothetical protein [Anaerolineaceae bacterium]HPL43506.1 hypothetical protein [Anaerolineaceae bacterium]HPY33673.1 hypothetical protein [Anaerolineaceae bacterium]